MLPTLYLLVDGTVYEGDFVHERMGKIMETTLSISLGNYRDRFLNFPTINEEVGCSNITPRNRFLHVPVIGRRRRGPYPILRNEGP